MTGMAQSMYRIDELDPGLLKTSFKIQTRWVVITGAPSCGKTTLINLLATRGYQTAPEGARLYLERELARGKTLQEIRSDHVTTERGIKEMHLEVERGLPPDACIFLDRGVPDCLAWYRYFGLDPNELLPDCFHARYASVFILDPLPVDLDGLRFQDHRLQKFTHDWHIRDYQALGYSLVSVPVLPPEDRQTFVLNVLRKQGSI